MYTRFRPDPVRPMTTATLNPSAHRRHRPGVRRSGWGRSTDPPLARLFARFAFSGLVAVIFIGAIGFVIVRRSATSGAIRQAMSLSELAGRGLAEPLITPGVLRGDPRDLARL